MVKVQVNREDVVRELARRVRKNENGVKHYLESAGIHTEKVTLQDIKALAEINPAAFKQMCYFLYPEIPAKEVAAADGKNGKAKGGEADGITISDENGNTITKTAGSSGDWTTILNSIVSVAGGTLTGIFGKQQDNSAAGAYAQQKSDMKLILGVGFAFVLLVLVFAFVLIKTKK